MSRQEDAPKDRFPAAFAATAGDGGAAGTGHPAWEEETKHLAFVVGRIQRHIERLSAASGGIKSAHERVAEDFWEDISLDVSTPDDLLESYADIAQQAAIVEELRARLGASAADLERLVQMMQKPYFARIDFAPDGGEPVTVYLGLRAFYDEELEADLVVDWRAPIASLYYEAAVGPAAYRAPDGPVRGHLGLKRQFIIRQRALKAMVDLTGVAAGDELLADILARPAAPHLRAVVETIQKEQSAVIRRDDYGVLLVEGAAGSGKTSVALMHVAYLLHHFRSTLSSEHILILSPNALFTEYIGLVLPELGETNVRRTTLFERIEAVLGGEAIEAPFEKLEYLLEGGTDDPRRALRRRIDAELSSPAYARLLSAFVRSLGPDDLVFRPIGDEEATWFSGEMIRRLARRVYGSGDPAWVRRLGALLERALARRAEAMLMATWVDFALDAVPAAVARRIHERLLRRADELPSDFDQTYERALRRWIVRRRAEAHREAIRAFGFVDAVATYRRLFAEPERYAELWRAFQAETGLDGAFLQSLQAHVADRLTRRPLAFEDAVAAAYVKTALTGAGEDSAVRFVVVDEAQDYAPPEVLWLLTLFPKARWMFLGDRAQALLPRPTVFDPASVDWLGAAYAGRGPLDMKTLPASYRSTAEIQALAAAVLGVPVPEGAELRHGPPPRLVVVPDHAALARALAEDIARLLQAGHGMIAVLCRTERECETAEAYLDRRVPYQRVYAGTRELRGKVLLMPAALAKGIEFDAVLLFDVSSRRYGEPEDRKLLYTLLMRAKHAAVLYAVGAPSPLIPVDRVSVVVSER
ncbi:RNA polymerase recycling motor HelD [Hydrogenibacillus schlegelii]|uniref:ATP-dependent DNA helicase rep n=2 Tax=Hydrogenibacillus schlegelii TaxID=1484 RepID=A0A132N7Y2_HYDSH|nr:RNA polymerase recycling motor HelD [Hydrogenibacillus schlegelii]KWX06224.1 hypothetical protein TR75_06580 [Hydrogenibacillus schlegelii]OAR04671.1 hypothetical protein SA87_09075 [Hydrogenibacillus schlegelii]PTQ54905.1 MAG: ATP-dependent DNA helicase rep [Hydrogenibacillus schlegelii]